MNFQIPKLNNNDIFVFISMHKKEVIFQKKALKIVLKFKFLKMLTNLSK